MSSNIVSFFLYILPAIILVSASIGIVWSLKNRKKYLIGYSLLLVGAGIHYYGLFAVGGWDGMGLSLFVGGGLVVLGLLVHFGMFIHSKLRMKTAK